VLHAISCPGLKEHIVETRFSIVDPGRRALPCRRRRGSKIHRLGLLSISFCTTAI